MSLLSETIFDSDSYKVGSHYNMYQDNVSHVYSYFECRNGAKFNTVKMFGLQPILMQLCEPVTQTELDEAYKLSCEHGTPLNKDGWQYIIDNYDGKLPLEIKAIPEGEIVNISVPLVTVINTDPNVPWLTNYVESMISRIWYPISIATMGYHIKNLLTDYLGKTSDSLDILDFQLHDFGSRSTTCREQAKIGGAAHLTNFYGTDTFIAMKFLKECYGAEKAAGFSIPASEHSIMTSLGKEGEELVFKQLLNKYPSGLLSVVIDSYNYEKFISEYVAKFKEQILARDGKLILRPDSGSPVKVSIHCYEMLADIFGEAQNKKGYFELNPKVGLIWGDGIGMDGIRDILSEFSRCQISSNNIAFGMGSGLLQKVNRDDLRCAFKCSAQKQDGEWVDIMKQPIDTSKVSKKGRLGVIKNNLGEYVSVNINRPTYSKEKDQLQTVFYNGSMSNIQTLDMIRARSW